jgi:hypothetical protein
LAGLQPVEVDLGGAEPVECGGDRGEFLWGQRRDSARTARTMITTLTSWTTSGAAGRVHDTGARSLWRRVEPRVQVGVIRCRAVLLAGLKHCSMALTTVLWLTGRISDRAMIGLGMLLGLNGRPRG